MRRRKVIRRGKKVRHYEDGGIVDSSWADEADNGWSFGLTGSQN